MIHASKTFDDNGMAWILLNREKLGLSLDVFPRRIEEFSLGGFIGVVNLCDCVSECDSPWFFGPRGYLLENPRLLDELIPFRGMPGLFNVPQKALIDAHLCPQCGNSLIHANIGNGTVDTYCEECGWPDENRIAKEKLVR
jgi:hypothetical protein